MLSLLHTQLRNQVMQMSRHERDHHIGFAYRFSSFCFIMNIKQDGMPAG